MTTNGASEGRFSASTVVPGARAVPKLKGQKDGEQLCTNSRFVHRNYFDSKIATVPLRIVRRNEKVDGLIDLFCGRIAVGRHQNHVT